ncbi:MAG TPA: PIG-L family deacetylase [Longimicrobiales bacterium]|nr:PIG-L family deacetylase [Longimicrobiales bacterium]
MSGAAGGLRLLCITAHPDDESLGFGGTLARYAAEGVEVSLLVATRGERGRYGDGSEPHPGPEELGRLREAELRAAAEVLGVRHVRLLGYRDGEVDRADPDEAVARIAAHVRELAPQVVLTFDPFGAYGHPDHIAVSQLAVGALVRAASDEALPGSSAPPHRVQKLYFVAWTERVWELYHRTFKVLRTTVDGETRSSVAWPAWSVTTTADAHDHWETVWAAVRCHRTQMAQYGPLTGLAPEDHRALWGPQEFYRVFSLVNGGRARERDLFEGLR